MKLGEMTTSEVELVAAKSIAILPLGAIEQHGPQLPVSTDASIINVIAEAVEKKLSKEVVLCPALSFGSSHHHLEFPGTMSLPPEIFTSVITQLVKSLLHGGFRKIILLNGHGGNITPVKQALSVLSHEFDDTLHPNIVLVNYWELAGKYFAGEPPMESPALCHACEYETSMMLELFPELVKMNKAKRAKRPKSNGYIPWEDDESYRGVSMVKRTHFVSSNGSSGNPQLANVQKGKHLMAKAIASAIDFTEQFKTWPLMKDLRK